MGFDVPDNIRTQKYAHVNHTASKSSQTSYIAATGPPHAVWFLFSTEQPVFIIQILLSYSRRIKGFHFGALPRVAATHESEYQPTQYFVHPDGTITKALLGSYSNTTFQATFTNCSAPTTITLEANTCCRLESAI